ncbi:MAG TPA: MotA/TolQ/ExbB proton channel family protein [Isosphaeraceae bacterium]
MPRPMTARALGVSLLLLACLGADGNAGAIADRVLRLGARAALQAIAWYEATPPAERIPTGGLVACGVLAVLTLLGRTIRLRHRRVIPPDFLKRFKDRMEDVRLDRGKVLDLCELNPSAASRVALASVKRWGRPTVDLERATTMAIRLESDGLRRNVGTLRRIAAMAPLLGLLGTLLAASRALNTPGLAWAPAIASALGPLTAGVAMAILSLVAYDGLMGRVEKLVGDLEKLGAQTVDAISLAVPPEPARTMPSPAHSHAPDPHYRRPSQGYPRPPHQPMRIDIPNAIARAMEGEDDLYDL